MYLIKHPAEEHALLYGVVCLTPLFDQCHKALVLPVVDGMHVHVRAESVAYVGKIPEGTLVHNHLEDPFWTGFPEDRLRKRLDARAYADFVQVTAHRFGKVLFRSVHVDSEVEAVAVPGLPQK